MEHVHHHTAANNTGSAHAGHNHASMTYSKREDPSSHQYMAGVQIKEKTKSGHLHVAEEARSSAFKLAISATLHCLLGCGLGEVAGMIIATYFGMSMGASMVLAIILGIVFGFALGMIPMLRNGFSFKKAFRIVLLAEGMSILVMEAFEVGTQVLIPGVMNAGLSSPLFWIGMTAGLFVGFWAAFPVNYYLIRKGVRHHH